MRKGNAYGDCCVIYDRRRENYDHGFFFFSSRRRHTRFDCDWSSDVCSSDLVINTVARLRAEADAYLLQVGGRFSNEQQQLIERLGLKRFVRTAPLADESTLQIGRASCRGRG